MCRHKFQPRYDELYSTGLKDVLACSRVEGPVEGGRSGYVSYLQKKTYVHDICVKCGDVIKRE